MKKIILIFTLVFLTEGYSQDPELFNHTWYFTHGEVDGDPLLPTELLTADMTMYISDIYIAYPYCGGGVSFEDVVFSNTGSTFELTGDAVILATGCSPEQSDEGQYTLRHNSIFGDLTGSTSPQYYNPFNYSVQMMGNHYQLSIENSQGDWAVYNSVLMSTNQFDNNNFVIYPNPVNEALHIKYNESVSGLSAEIFNMEGKSINLYALEISHTELNLKELRKGLYFLVIRDAQGQKTTKKFIKK